MDADIAVFKIISVQVVIVGVIHEHAFVGFVNHIVGNVGIVDIVEHDALVAAADGDIAIYFQAVGKHQGIADVVAHGNIAADFAVVGVHIVHGITQVREAVVFIGIVSTGIGKNTVAPLRNIVADHLRTGRVPNGYAVAALGHAQFGVADDFIAAHHRVFRAMQVHAYRIFQNIIVFHQGIGSSFFKIYACIHCGQAEAGLGNGQIAQNNVGSVYGNGTAAAVALDFGGAVGRAFDGQGFVDIKFGFVHTRSQFQDIACLGLSHGFCQIAAGRNGDDCGRGRLKQTAEHKYQGGTLP